MLERGSSRPPELFSSTYDQESHLSQPKQVHTSAQPLGSHSKGYHRVDLYRKIIKRKMKNDY